MSLHAKMNILLEVLKDMLATVSISVRKAIFWRAMLVTNGALIALWAAVEIPRFVQAVRLDRERVVEMLQERRRCFSSIILRLVEHRMRVLQAPAREEAQSLLNIVRGTNMSFPGVLSMAVLKRGGDASAGWRIVQEGSRADGQSMNRVLSEPTLGKTLGLVEKDREPRISPLFRWRASPNAEERILVGLISAVPAEVPAWRRRDGGLFVVLIDTLAWSREAEIPKSLRSLGCYLANDPFDGILVDADAGRTIEDVSGFDGLRIQSLSNPGDPLVAPSPAPPVASAEIDGTTKPRTPSADARRALIVFENFGGSRFQCHVDFSPEFLASQSHRRFLRDLPVGLVRILFVGSILAMMWTIFRANQRQIKKLAEAQQTVQRLDQHRSLIQQEIHDHIIQHLTMLNMKVAATSPGDAEAFIGLRSAIVGQLDYLRGELRRLLQDGVHRLESFDEMILQVQSLCRQMEEQTGARCSVKTTGTAGFVPRPEILFRACRFTQELVGNAIRHGKASRVEVEIRTASDASSITLRVVDNGSGFDPEKCTLGYGLRSMQSFARKHRGALTIQRQATRGMVMELNMGHHLGRLQS
ncbi:MAG: hypothetical protein RIT19_2124 [Verrucomicrobiota bacterium]